MVKWAFLDSVWFSPAGACRQAVGACWSIVTQNFRFIIFGFYPYEEQWRPLAALLILLGLLTYSHDRRRWSKRLGYGWVIGLVAMTILMRGGLWGLPPVESEKWGGLPLTLLLAIFALTAAYPLGVLLALGRQSRMPVIKLISVVYIEIIRGVPLISLLFMGSIILPLFLPEGVNIDKILRALAAMILFTAAYIAEVVRGGLQAMAHGQYEAAQSIGLSYYLSMRLVILPQALKIVIPGIVNSFISLFKDTSLVLIIGIFDLLGIVQFNFTDSNWASPNTPATGYVFAAAVFWLFCFGMSRYSIYTERRLDTGYRR